jgi:inosine-uridine nucleoside N-ribohydrolase
VPGLRLHIDTDGGVDDALALILAARGAELASVSAVFGNTYVDQAAANARGVLRLSGCPADVFIGAGASLARRKAERMRPAHGVDGLNGSGFPQRWKLPLLGRGHGVSLLAFAARRGVTGVFLGPLTNLAHGLLDDPAAFRGWRPAIMAGAFETDGSTDTGADFNSWSDPEALQRVLDAGVRPRLVPLDVTTKVLLTREQWAAAVQAGGPPLLRRLAPAVDRYMAFQREKWGVEGCHPHDAVTLLAALAPDLFTFEPVRLSVAGDPLRRGRLTREAGPDNAELAVAVRAEDARDHLLALLTGAV